VKKYPNVKEIIERKERHRRRLAALPFEQKIEMIFKLRERREFFQAARAASEGRERVRASVKLSSDPQGESI
jgi:hypothetical protein